MLNCPVGTVKTHMLRGKQKLKLRLAAWAPDRGDRRMNSDCRSTASRLRPNPDDDWLDAGCAARRRREHRAAYLDDDGFTARVMAALPAPATLPAWRKPAIVGAVGGGRTGVALALPGAVERRRARSRTVLAAQPVSLRRIAAAIAALGARPGPLRPTRCAQD